MTSGEGHPRRWAILGVLVVSLLIVVLDNSVLNIALPTIQRDLNATQSELLWSIDSYMLSFAALLFTMGVLGDRFGRKRVLMLGMLLFGITSFIASFAETTTFLIAMRAVMGAGGAAVMPTTLAIITVVFPPHERGKAIGTWAGSVGAAIALGPVLGGVLLENPQWSNWMTGNDWGSVFLINVPIVIAGLIGAWMVVPETRNPHARSLDFTGLVLSIAGLVLVVYGIIHASETKDWLALSVVIPGTIGLLVLALFVWLEYRSDHASFDVTLFANRGYSVALSAVSLAFFAMSGMTFVLPFYLQVVRDLSTLQAGLCFLPFAVGQLIAAPRSAAMVLRFGYRRVMGVGLGLVVLSLIGMTQLRVDTELWWLLTLFFVFGIGMGNAIAPGSTVLQNVLPLARAGAGSAVQNTVRQVFGALGVAIVGTVLANQFATRMEPVLAGLPPQFPQAARDAASESVIAADAVLDRAVEQGLPAAVAETTRAASFEAFVSSAHVAFTISLVVVGLALLAIVLLLPHLTPPTKGMAAGGGPAGPDSADDRVRREAAHYAEELAEEIEPRDPEP